MHSESVDARRGELAATAQGLLAHLAKHLPADAAADQLAAAFLQQRLPPPPPVGRAAGEPAVGDSVPMPQSLDTVRVQLAALGLARLVVEDEAAVVYHCLGNERRSHAHGEGSGGKEPCSPVDGHGAAAEADGDACGVADAADAERSPGRLAYPLDCAPALEQLLAAPPRFCPMANKKRAPSLALCDIDSQGLEECVLHSIVRSLCDEGILMLA